MYINWERWRSLIRYCLLRLALAPLLVLVVATIVFALMRLAPGDPIDAIVGTRAPLVVKANLRQQTGLDGSLVQQYFRYLGGLLRFDLGKSLSTRGEPVSKIIQDFFPATAELAIYSTVIALVIGISLGILTATKPRWELPGKLFSIVTYALPLFWLGMVLQLLFSVQLGWFPLGGRIPTTIQIGKTITGLYTIDSLLQGNLSLFLVSLHHLVLPSFALGLVLSGIFERIMRVNLQEALQSDHVEAARARGISERRILWSHGIRNALIPVVTVFGLTFAALLGGAVMTEVTFSWPGLAHRLYSAILGRDYPVVQGLVVFFAIIATLFSILVDILNALIDPRIRY
ncbi:MAG: ABC transporter permease [Pseudanabaenaceae cyanobacterium SKYGB_i_bin29]|nr:ABC transporter permease [Pseudanabaenaceae cyanobacterium SKYG29]MDW8420289.1 ABC transporter permease [Pseudanabaenaceae cyanobacterium SKYGB_i_bin29]